MSDFNENLKDATHKRKSDIDSSPESLDSGSFISAPPFQLKINEADSPEELSEQSTKSQENYQFAAASGTPSEGLPPSGNALNENITQLQSNSAIGSTRPNYGLNAPPYQLASDKPEQEVSKSSSSNGLPDGVKQKMEGAFNSDFSNVNIHTNSSQATNLNAQAFTQGTNIHFAAGKYNPESDSGQKLIGHELTHVIQQSEGKVKPTMKIGSENINNDKKLENEADIKGEKAVQFKFNSEGPTNVNTSSSNATTVIQRDETDTSEGTVVFPFELGEVNTCGQLCFRLLEFGNMFTALSRKITSTDHYSGNPESLDYISSDIFDIQRSFIERGWDSSLDPSDVDFFNNLFNEDWVPAYNTEFNALKSHVIRNTSGIGGRLMPEMSSELAEAQRVAFEAGNTSELERLGTIVTAIQEYNSSVHTWISRISTISSAVRNSTVLQTLNNATENISGIAENIGHVITGMRSIDTLISGGSETQQSLNQFQASLDTIDIGMNFVSCVPFLGSLWSEYYYPAATRCIQLLGRISQERDRSNRLLTWISNNWHSERPPNLSGASISFLGGQAVFSFMWNIYFNNYSFSQTAENFFMGKEDELNAICPTQMRISGEWNPFEDNHIVNFESWATNNKSNIWTMLYGADLPFPGTNTRPGD